MIYKINITILYFLGVFLVFSFLLIDTFPIHRAIYLSVGSCKKKEHIFCIFIGRESF